MNSLLRLPSEILSHIVHLVSINGELKQFRQCHSRLQQISKAEARTLLDSISLRYGLSTRAVGLYFTHRLGTSDARLNNPSLVNVIALDCFVRSIDAVAADIDQTLRSGVNSLVAPPQRFDRNAFLLFAVITHRLSSARTVLSMTGTVLAPCSSGETIAPKVLDNDFGELISFGLTLSELESAIAAINVCATRLWSTIFLFRPRQATVSSFGCLSGQSFNTDQAILTEHTIWKGPKWVTRLIERYGPSSRQEEVVIPAADFWQFDDRAVREGVWKGSQENGALLAANGVARFLWDERQERIERSKRDNTPQAMTITEMNTNPAVSRISSGDV